MTDSISGSALQDGSVTRRYDDHNALLRVKEMDEGDARQCRTAGCRALPSATTDWVKTISCQPVENDDAANLCFDTQHTRSILADVDY